MTEQLKENEMKYGFRVQKVTELPELEGRAFEMLHENSGARLLWLDRPEDNMTFSAVFRTIPEDDTGVFHILEHSLLGGSKRFPVKEPFLELLKNSMNTFLNAMTFEDKTMYPVASRNRRDFMNLVQVYCDAVFSPLIEEKQEIFLQEGWRYELGEEVSLNGVVFNEMKGAYADPDTIMDHEIAKGLFPESCYGYESGGHPEAIPGLSYEMFLGAYHRFYTPSNCFLLLDGAVDLGEILAFLDREYLGRMDKGEAAPLPGFQKKVKAEGILAEYQQDPELPLEGYGRLGMGYVIGSFDQRERIIAAHIIAGILCESNHSPLTRALLDAGLCEDVSMEVKDGILQPYLQLDIRNMEHENRLLVEQVVRDTISALVEKGIDKMVLDAAISTVEFEMKEKDYDMPKGLVYQVQVMESWLYDGDPLANLSLGNIFEEFRQKAEHGYFEQLLRELILENEHHASVLMIPSYTYDEEAQEREDAYLKEITGRWSREDEKYYIALQEGLEQWQESEDTREALDTMPVLTLADVDAAREISSLEEMEGIFIDRRNADGIIYLRLYFDLGGYGTEQLQYASLLAGFLGKLGTGKHGAQEIQMGILTYFGDLSFEICSFSEKNRRDTVSVKLGVTAGILEANLPKALELLSEILLETEYIDYLEMERIVSQEKLELYQNLTQDGAQTALERAEAALSAEAAVAELTAGYEYYQWLKDVDMETLKAWDFEAFAGSIFGRNCLVGSATLENPENYIREIRSFMNSLPVTEERGKAVIGTLSELNDDIEIPGDTGYAAVAAALPESYSGILTLLCHIVTYHYLWNEVRVKGGAYGTGMKNYSNGIVTCHSYRDPSVLESIDIFYDVPEFLEDFLKSHEDLEGEIIGTLAEITQPETAKESGVHLDSFYFRGISKVDREALYAEVRNPDRDKLDDMVSQLKRAFEDMPACIVAGKEQLDEME